MEDEDTLVLARSKKADNFLRLVPANRALTEDIVLNLATPARIGRLAGAPNHPNFYGVQNKVVSRAHVDLWEAEGKYYMKDLGSASGSFVNGKRLSQPSVQSSPVEVHPDDLIQLGSNYTEDERTLNTDPSLRCVLVRAIFRGTKTFPQPPPLMNMGLISPPNSGSPKGGSEVDLNNLTYIIKTQQKAAQLKQEMAAQPPGSTSPFFSPVLSPQTNSPVLVSPPILPRSSSRDELLEIKKNAASDMMNFELSRKKELEEKLKAVQLQATSALSSVAQEREQFIVAIAKANNKVVKATIQQGPKDVISVNTKAWDVNKKLLLQDHRPRFSKTPYVEVILDAAIRTGNKYNVVNHNGGALMGTIEKLTELSAQMSLADGTIYKLQGDVSESYSVLMNGQVVAEVTSQENSRNIPKGNLTRVLSVMLEKDHVNQLVLSAVVLMGLVAP